MAAYDQAYRDAQFERLSEKIKDQVNRMFAGRGARFGAKDAIMARELAKLRSEIETSADDKLAQIEERKRQEAVQIEERKRQEARADAIRGEQRAEAAREQSLYDLDKADYWRRIDEGQRKSAKLAAIKLRANGMESAAREIERTYGIESEDESDIGVDGKSKNQPEEKRGFRDFSVAPAFLPKVGGITPAPALRPMTWTPRSIIAQNPGGYTPKDINPYNQALYQPRGWRNSGVVIPGLPTLQQLDTYNPEQLKWVERQVPRFRGTVDDVQFGDYVDYLQWRMRGAGAAGERDLQSRWIQSVLDANKTFGERQIKRQEDLNAQERASQEANEQPWTDLALKTLKGESWKISDPGNAPPGPADYAKLNDKPSAFNPDLFDWRTWYDTMREQGYDYGGGSSDDIGLELLNLPPEDKPGDYPGQAEDEANWRRLQNKNNRRSTLGFRQYPRSATYA